MPKPLNRIGAHLYFLVIGICLPMQLLGQDADSIKTVSILGQVIGRSLPAPPFPPTTLETPLSGKSAEVFLIAEGDTLRTEINSSGVFSFSGIESKRVTISAGFNPKREEDARYHNLPYMRLFYGTFDLMPGDYIMYIPYVSYSNMIAYGVFKSANDTVFTIEGDTWVYHYPDNRAVSECVIEKLIGMPGVEYNKKKGTITISGDSVSRAEVNGAYVFALNPKF